MMSGKCLRHFVAIGTLGGMVAFSNVDAQTVTYSGKVVDQSGTGLPWALIRLEGGTEVVQSSADGSFSFTGPVSLAIRPERFNSASGTAETLAIQNSESFLLNGRTLAVTHGAVGRWFQRNPSGTQNSTAPSEAPLAKVSTTYSLKVTKVNYQEGIFSQSSTTATGLVLTLLKSTTDTATYAFEKQLCLDTINACRATMGLKPLAWSKSLEAFADEGARYDAGFGIAHGHFSKFSTRAVPADAENALPGWPLKNYKTVAAVVQKGTKMMWDERLDPTGQQGHYLNIKGDQTIVGCGIFTTPTGDVWVVQDFK